MDLDDPNAILRRVITSQSHSQDGSGRSQCDSETCYYVSESHQDGSGRSQCDSDTCYYVSESHPGRIWTIAMRFWDVLLHLRVTARTDQDDPNAILRRVITSQSHNRDGSGRSQCDSETCYYVSESQPGRIWTIPIRFWDVLLRLRVTARTDLDDPNTILRRVITSQSHNQDGAGILRYSIIFYDILQRRRANYHILLYSIIFYLCPACWSYLETLSSGWKILARLLFW